MNARSAFDFGASTPAGEKRGSLISVALSLPSQRITCENTARAMGDSELFIKQRHVRNCYQADPSYGKGVAAALGISWEEALSANDPAKDE